MDKRKTQIVNLLDQLHKRLAQILDHGETKEVAKSIAGKRETNQVRPRGEGFDVASIALQGGRSSLLGLMARSSALSYS